MTDWYISWIIFIWKKVVHAENTGFDVTWSWKPTLHLISHATLGRLCLQQRSYVLAVFRSFCLWGRHLLLSARFIAYYGIIHAPAHGFLFHFWNMPALSSRHQSMLSGDMWLSRNVIVLLTSLIFPVFQVWDCISFNYFLSYWLTEWNLASPALSLHFNIYLNHSSFVKLPCYFYCLFQNYWSLLPMVTSKYVCYFSLSVIIQM